MATATYQTIITPILISRPRPLRLPRIPPVAAAPPSQRSMELSAVFGLYNAAAVAAAHVRATVEAARPLSAISYTKNTAKNLRQPREPYEVDMDADLRAMERDPREWPAADYMTTTQAGHMSASMRADLVLWMEAFARQLGDLPPGTLCRAVTYLDRLLSAVPVAAHDEMLRLIGSAAVSLGAKYEQSSSGRKLDADVVDSFVGSTVARVEAAEREVVQALDFVLDGPTAYTFVERFTRFFEEEDKFLVRSLALRLIDLTLPEYGFVGRFLPSVVAASALFLARRILAMPWNRDLEEVTGYQAVELMGCICALELPS